MATNNGQGFPGKSGNAAASKQIESMLAISAGKTETYLSEGPNNNNNGDIQIQDTTVADWTKNNRIVRRLKVLDHNELLELFLPYITYSIAILFFVHTILATWVLLFTD